MLSTIFRTRPAFKRDLKYSFSSKQNISSSYKLIFQLRNFSNLKRFDVVICGAGFAGISTAYHLVNHKQNLQVALIDAEGPLNMTSAVSSECYRTFWLDSPMVKFMTRSINLFEKFAEESNNIFHLNANGYAFISLEKSKIHRLEEMAHRVKEYGGGDVRIHHSFDSYKKVQSPGKLIMNQGLDGADVIYGSEVIRQIYPFLTPKSECFLHIRRAGWLSGQQFAIWLLEQAQKTGRLQFFRRNKLQSIQLQDEKVHSITIEHSISKQQEILKTSAFVNCCGPWLQVTNKLLGAPPLPIFNELHAKTIFINKANQAFPKDTPMLIGADSVSLTWTEEEKEFLENLGELGNKLMQTLPSGAHFHRHGNSGVYALWDFVHKDVKVEEFPDPKPQFNEYFPEIVLKGLITFIPSLQNLLDQLQKNMFVVDGGYYCKTEENRPIIGQYGPKGAYICGAFSGFGLMASPASGELITKHILNEELPISYSTAFIPGPNRDPPPPTENLQL